MLDDVIEVNIGEESHPQYTFVSKMLQNEEEQLLALLQELKDSFAKDYTRMPRLDRTLIEHKLSIKYGFKPYIQP